MARTNNLTNFLTDVSSAIKQKTGDNTPIPASNFDTEILSIEIGGNYQSKTLNVAQNGNYNLLPDTGYDAISDVSISVNVSPILQNKTITENGSYTADQNYDGLGTVIVNVQGGTINNQDKTITQNGSYTADSGYTGLGEVTVNVPSGSGDVKLFDTVEHMQADPDASEGDLAVVYREELTGVTEESEFSSCIFPQTVVLDEAFTGSIYGRFGPVDDVWFDGMVDMSSSGFRFRGYGESSEISVRYTSQDGITYTRTDGGEELQEFGVTVKYQPMRPWNDVFSNFMKIGGKYFDGLYQYASYNDTENYLVISDPKATMSNSIWKAEVNIVDEISVGVCNKIKQLLTSMIDGTLNTFLVEKIDDNHFKSYVCSDGNYHYGATFIQDADNSNNVYIGSYIGLDGASIRPISIYDIDISTDTISLNTTITNFTLLKDIRNNTSEYIPTQLITNTNRKFVLNGNLAVNVTSTTFGKEEILYKFVFPTKYKYLPAPNQLTAVAEDVYGTDFMGKNGVENGILTTNVSNSFADVNAEVFAKLQQQYDNMQPRVLTDQDKEINTNIYFIPTNKNGEVLIDTSNVTNMNNMFANCSNLTSIPLLDTSGVTYMGYMFYSCSNLTSIPLLDTSSVTNMYSIFMRCTSLTTIPLLDTSSVTNMSCMFMSCTSLTTVPQLNTSSVTEMGSMFENCTSLTTIPLLDTSGVTYMRSMFANCTSLTTVPQLNTSSVTGMYSMFDNCSALSNESLNNILIMCANATRVTSNNKTLVKIGLSQEQAQICTTLSNYQAFVNAGWTTGY